MPRACVIVLDAVGAGALPDAEQYGDEGSDTLGNVAKAVDRKSTRLNSSHDQISYAVFCLKKKKEKHDALLTSRASPRVALEALREGGECASRAGAVARLDVDMRGCVVSLGWQRFTRSVTR